MTQPSCPDPARLRRLLDGALPADEQSALSGHLETCEGCQQTAEALISGGTSWPALVGQIGEAEPAPDGALRRVIEQARGEVGPAGDPPPGEGGSALDFLSP